MSGVRVGIFPPVGQHASRTGQRAATLALIAGSGIDHVCVGDHVSFFTGAGSHRVGDPACSWDGALLRLSNCSCG